MVEMYYRIVKKARKDGYISLLLSIPVFFLNNVISPIIGPVYRRTIHKVLPVASEIRRNDIVIGNRRYGDRLLPKEFHQNPSAKSNYKAGNSDLVSAAVNPGDTVVCVGGGYGITTVAAARESGESGQVYVYEGSKQQVEIIKDATSFENVADQCSIHHGIVGEAISVYEGKCDPPQVLPESLPNCDVLEMDCEGSEYSILRQLEQRPREIIVEIHPHRFEGTGSDVTGRLEEMGYQILAARDQQGMELSEEQLNDMLEFERSGSKTTEWGGIHPPIIRAKRS